MSTGCQACGEIARKIDFNRHVEAPNGRTLSVCESCHNDGYMGPDFDPDIRTCYGCGVTADANKYSCNCTEGQ